MITRLALAILLLLTAPAIASETVVSGQSDDRIEINANFRGSNLLIYGAVKRDTPIPPTAPLDVIIVVEGPSEPAVVRRKAHRYGMWINTDVVTVDRAPSFYAIASTRPLNEILSDTEDLRHGISVQRTIRSVGAPSQIMDSPAFTDALIRLRQDKGVYSVNQEAVRFAEATLFRTDITLPANLTEGIYKTRIFLVRSRQIVSFDERTIYVRKVGLERWLFNVAHRQPAIYATLALALAAFAGWAASELFRLMRR